MKVCFKCNIEKPLSDYYKHQKIGDGHLNKCKDCTKKDTKERLASLKDDLNFLESERARGREKHHRLYRDKPFPVKQEDRKKRRDLWCEKYPEKCKAASFTQKIRRKHGGKGFNMHHWSYQEAHYVDVIKLTIKEHYKAHRFIVYDQERMMYRRYDNNELLDTKEKHESFIRHCIETKED